MTAGVILNTGSRFRLWPQPVAEQLHEIGVPTVDRKVWKQHMDNIVWPIGTHVGLRLWRIVAGMITGFWFGWLISGGKQSASEYSVPVVAVLMVVALVVTIVGAVLGALFGLVDWSFVTWAFVPIALLVLFVGALFSAGGNPLHDDQLNWFYKTSGALCFSSDRGPRWKDVPKQLQGRVNWTEKHGWVTKIAWNTFDPLVFVHPPYQPWRKVCIGGWDTGMAEIDNL